MRLAEQKKMLQAISREMSRGQNEIKTLQFNIKKCPQENQPQLTEQFNALRSLLGDLDIRFSQKKKSIKFDIQLVDEREKLDQLNEKIDGFVDDEEVDQINEQLGESAQAPKTAKGNVGYGVSNADTNFQERFKKEKEIEKELQERNPARFYQTMNFDLQHMKAHKEQKDKILAYDRASMTLRPTGERMKGYMKDGFRHLVCDV